MYLLRKSLKAPNSSGIRTVMQQQKQQTTRSHVTFVPGFTLSQGSLAPPGEISKSFGLAPNMSGGTSTSVAHTIARIGGCYKCTSHAFALR
jgi:hypothetical protein